MSKEESPAKGMLVDILVMQTLIDVVSKVEPDVLEHLEKRLRYVFNKVLDDVLTACNDYEHREPIAQPVTTSYVCDNGAFLRTDDEADPEEMN